MGFLPLPTLKIKGADFGLIANSKGKDTPPAGKKRCQGGEQKLALLHEPAASLSMNSHLVTRVAGSQGAWLSG